MTPTVIWTRAAGRGMMGLWRKCSAGLVPAMAGSLLVLLLPAAAPAQAVKGELLGNLTDQSGLALPGATVTTTETNTNISYSTVTNESGYYIFSNLKDGVYRVTAELTGFKKAIREDVAVQVNATVRIDLRMEIGAVTESVTVTGETPVLQTDRADTGRTIESLHLEEVPLAFNRNFQGMMAGARQVRSDCSARTPSSSTRRTACRPM